MAIITVPGVGQVATKSGGVVAVSASNAAPTWQDKLTSYKTDAAAAAAEIERAKNVYATKMAAGDVKGANAAHTWANQIRNAQGLVAGTDYNAKTGAVIPKDGTGVGNGSGNGGGNGVGNGGGNGTPDIITPTPVTPTPASSTTTYIDGIIAARKAAALANLEKSKNAALSNLEAEKATIAPMYYDKRNQTAATNQQQARNFAEFMAARGMTGSGANAQAEISRSGVYQANIGALNNQESAANTDIARRTTDVNNAYESDLTSAQNEIEASRLQALLEQFNQDRNFNLSEANVTGMYNGKNTLAKDNQTWNQATDIGTMTGTFTNPITGAVSTTLTKQEADWAKDPNNPVYQKQLFDVEISKAKAKYADETAKAEFDKIQNDLEVGKIDLKTAEAKFKNLDTELKNANDLALAKIKVQDSTVIKNNAAAGASNASAELSGVKAKDIKNGGSGTGKTKSPTAKSVDSEIKTQFKVSTDPIKKTTTTNNPKGVVSLVAKSGLTNPTEAKNLLAKYGVDNKTIANYLLGLPKQGYTDKQVDEVRKSLGMSESAFNKAIQ